MQVSYTRINYKMHFVDNDHLFKKILFIYF